MSLRRFAILLQKELYQGPRNFFFIWALLAPIAISLVVTAAFGSLFDHRPSLGIADQGDSQLVAMIGGLSSVDTREYRSEIELKDAVASGAIDSGLVLVDGFDDSVVEGNNVALPIYIWGESLAQNRVIIAAAVANQVRELAGHEMPLEIKSIPLGDKENVPWNDRLLPFIVLMSVMLAGIALSGTSFLNEKEKKTIDALIATPTTIGELLLSKAVLGIVTGVFMGIVILVLNQAMGSQPGLLIMIMFLGSIMATGIGLTIACLSKDLTTFFAGMKVLGLLLYAPALIYMFPSMPQWIGKIFPTYYVIEPIVEISQRGGAWPDISLNVFILIALNILLFITLRLVVSKKRQYAN